MHTQGWQRRLHDRRALGGCQRQDAGGEPAVCWQGSRGRPSKPQRQLLPILNRTSLPVNQILANVSRSGFTRTTPLLLAEVGQIAIN